jgi:hypothetical protein
VAVARITLTQRREPSVQPARRFSDPGSRVATSGPNAPRGGYVRLNPEVIQNRVKVLRRAGWAAARALLPFLLRHQFDLNLASKRVSNTNEGGYRQVPRLVLNG